MIRLTKQQLIASCCLAITSTAYSASTYNSHSFQIEPQTLQSALAAFSEQSELQLFYSAALVKNHQTAGVSGDLNAVDALKTLLKGSDLNYKIIDKDTITLEKSTNIEPRRDVILAAGDDLSENSQELKTITVYGEEQNRNRYSTPDSNVSTKTDTPFMENPMSVQVINKSVLEDQQSITVSESLKNVSGVIARNPILSPNFEPTLMRGFAGMQMLDGFYQNLNTGDQGSLVNVEKIAALKGANATLYSGGGGSPVGGIINLVSKLPKPEAFYEIGVKGGSYDFIQPYIDLNQPLNDNVLFRLTAEYTNNESHINVIETERFNVNPTLLITDNESTDFTLQGKFSKWEQQDYQGLPATGTVTGDFNINPELFIGPNDIENSFSEFYGVWGTLDHEINDMWSVTAKGRYAKSKHDTISQGIFGSDGFGADQPFSPPSTWGLINTELFQEQEELNFQLYAKAIFDIGVTKNTFLLGADFSELDEKGFLDFDFTPVGSVDLTAPAFLDYNYPGARQNNQFVKNTTYGGYVQLQSSIYDRLHLLAGVRLAYIETAFKNTDPFFGFEASSDVSRFLPNVGAVLDVTENFSLFANYSEGMRAQSGVNFVSTPKPELSYQMEAGVKVNFSDDFTGQVSVYQIDREDVAVTDFTDAQFRSVAKGKQRSHGVETNFSWQATDGLSFLGNYTFTEAEFQDSLAGVAEGNALPGIPAHSGRFWTNYDFQQPMLNGLSMGAGIYTQSSVYLANANLFKADSYYSIDMSMAYKIQEYKLGVSVKNLTNEDTYQRLNYFGSRVTPMQGTAVFVNASARF